MPLLDSLPLWMSNGNSSFSNFLINMAKIQKRNANSQPPTPALLNQKLWRGGLVMCVLTDLPTDSDAL